MNKPPIIALDCKTVTLTGNACPLVTMKAKLPKRYGLRSSMLATPDEPVSRLPHLCPEGHIFRKGSRVSLGIASRGASLRGFDRRPQLKAKLPGSYRNGESGIDPQLPFQSPGSEPLPLRRQKDPLEMRGHPKLSSDRQRQARRSGSIFPQPFLGPAKRTRNGVCKTVRCKL
jgi:hypothetical protein